MDDTNHLSIGYLTPDSTNEEMVKRITPDCLSYLDAGIGNVAIEFMGPQSRAACSSAGTAPSARPRPPPPATLRSGGVPSASTPSSAKLITTTSPNWFTGERRG